VSINAGYDFVRAWIWNWGSSHTEETSVLYPYWRGWTAAPWTAAPQAAIAAIDLRNVIVRVPDEIQEEKKDTPHVCALYTCIATLRR
jgi:hypothetical protein